MKTLESFIVSLDKTRKDTITMGNGQELYLDSKYEEFKHRVTGGEVVSVPAKFDTGVSVGDTLYFHHHVVTQKGQHLGLNPEEGLFVVRYNHYETLANQAIAYKSKETGEINTLGGWLLLEPIPEDQSNKVVNGIEIVSLKEIPTKKARFIKHNERTEWLDVKPGDVVHFKKGSDYEIEVDGKKLFRIRPDELMYVEVQYS